PNPPRFAWLPMTGRQRQVSSLARVEHGSPPRCFLPATTPRSRLHPAQRLSGRTGDRISPAVGGSDGRLARMDPPAPPRPLGEGVRGGELECLLGPVRRYAFTVRK